METIMGMDFGTTNSALAVLEDGAARVIDVNNRESSERTLRSVLLLEENGSVLVGQKAIDRYVEEGGGSGRFLQSLKAFLPNASFTTTTIFRESYTLERLIAIILGEIRDIGTRRIGSRTDRVMMGRPVIFSDDPEKDALAEQRLRAAARIAGFSDIHFEYEPVAATLAYFLQLPVGTEQTVLMGDFGGGTSDFTVMRLRAGEIISQAEKKKRILAIGGVYVGGDTFDGRIMRDKLTPYFGRDVKYRSHSGMMHVPAYIIHGLCEWHRIPFLRDRRTMDTLSEIYARADQPHLIRNLENLILGGKSFMIFQAIERAKKELSTESETRVTYEDHWLRLDERITRTEFEEMIQQDIDSIATCVDKVIADAKVGREGINKVLLTGGSSFVPAVRRLFEARFGANRIVYLDAFTSVAHGLALSADLRG